MARTPRRQPPVHFLHISNWRAISEYTGGLRRQLRREAGRVPLRCSHRCCGTRGRPPGEMDRGPAGASHRLGERDQSRDATGSGGRARRARARACVGSDRGRGCTYPRAGPGHALSHAWQSHRSVRHPPRRCAQPVVLANKTPSGLNRGFGGPQTHYAFERLMQRSPRSWVSIRSTSSAANPVGRKDVGHRRDCLEQENGEDGDSSSKTLNMCKGRARHSRHYRISTTFGRDQHTDGRLTALSH